MAIIKFSDRPFYQNPWLEFDKVRREMERLSDLFEKEASGRQEPPTFPPLTLSEKGDAIIVRFEMPGVAPSDPEIFVEGNVLTIEGERRPPSAERDASFHRREIGYGRFSRKVTLPAKIDPQKTVATAAEGILTIIMQKAPKVTPRQIVVDVD